MGAPSRSSSAAATASRLATSPGTSATPRVPRRWSSTGWRSAASGDVVLIEDSESDAELTIRAMRHITDRVERCRDGGEAWAFLDNLALQPHAPRPRVVFLDNKLPLRDGLEILRRMKSDPDLK